jgi:hypothetical protein
VESTQVGGRSIVHKIEVERLHRHPLQDCASSTDDDDSDSVAGEGVENEPEVSSPHGH